MKSCDINFTFHMELNSVYTRGKIECKNVFYHDQVINDNHVTEIYGTLYLVYMVMRRGSWTSEAAATFFLFDIGDAINMTIVHSISSCQTVGREPTFPLHYQIPLLVFPVL